MFPTLGFATIFHTLSPKDGLAHPAVISIHQDRIGRIWFGTEEGVSIYDGMHITTYKPYCKNSAPLFLGNSASDITSDFNGDIFFRTENGLVRYDLDLEKFHMISRMKINSVYSHQGVIWATTADKLYKWDSKQSKLKYICSLPAKRIYGMLIDHKGDKWFTSDEGLFKTKDYTAFKKVLPFRTYNIIESADNHIWVGSANNGLTEISESGKLIRYTVQNSASKGMVSNDIRQIAEDNNHDIWFGTYGGLHRFNRKSGIFKVYNRTNKAGGLSNSSVYSIFKDKSGTLWIGTYYGGVNYFHPQMNDFFYYSASDDAEGLSHPFAGDMTEDKNGNIWICTEGGGLNMLNAETKTIKHFRKDAYPYYMPCTNLKSVIYDDTKNLLYLGTNYNGLYTYDITNNRFNNIINPRDSKSEMSTVNIVQKCGAYLYLSTNKGIFRYSLLTDSSTFIFRPNVRFSDIHIDKNQYLWILEKNVVHKYDITNLKKVKTYSKIIENGAGRIIRLYESSDGSIYLTTFGNGIMKLDKKSDIFKKFPDSEKDMLSNYCYRIIETPQNNLLITTDKGIYILSKKGDIMQTMLFTNQALPITAFTRDCGITISFDSTIYIGSTSGIIGFKESNYEKSINRNQVYFSRLFVANKEIHAGDSTGILSCTFPETSKITLSDNQNRFDIFIASESFAGEIQSHIYECRLKGFENDWNPIYENRISYSNLPSGNYTLEVREKNMYGNDADKNNYEKLEICILYPWYLTPAALIAWISIAAIIIYILYKTVKKRRQLYESIRKEQIEKEQLKTINEAKLRFFTNISHEFRTPLTLIIGNLQILIQKCEQYPSIRKRLIKTINKAQEMNYLVTELIDFRKFEQNKMRLHVSAHFINDFISNIYDSFKEQAELQNIKFDMSQPSNNAKIWFDGKQMTKVFYNLLSNAFKFTPAGGHVSIDITESNECVKIMVSDNGIGIEDKNLERIFDQFYQEEQNEKNMQSTTGSGIGLALVKSIIDMHCGKITAKSKKGYGTIFSVEIKKGNEHFKDNENITLTDEEESSCVSELPVNNSYDSSSELAESPAFSDDPTDKPNVLLVEDNKELMEVLTSLFSQIYTVRTASNGEEAMNLIRESQPDLIVSDIMMPVMDGMQLCKNIKNNIETSHIPVVLLTALTQREQNIEGLLCGADDYISKPFDSKMLLIRCNNIIRSRRIMQKCTSDNRSESNLFGINNLDKGFMEQIDRTIKENLASTDFDIDELAGKMKMSRSVFYTKFKAVTGQTPNEYITAFRLKEAAYILKNNPDISMTEVSEMVGFSSQSYFSRKFKEMYNVPPKSYASTENKNK